MNLPKTKLLVFLCYCFIFGNATLHAQSLYSDALELADAIEKNQLWIKIEADTTVEISFKSASADELDEANRIGKFSSLQDSILLEKNGEYTFDSYGRDFQIFFQYDTLLLVDSVLNNNIKINNQSLYFESLIAKETGEIEKKPYLKKQVLKIHSILGVHYDNEILNNNIADYNALVVYDAYKNNPYLARLLPQDWFKNQAWTDSKNLISVKVNTEIQSRKSQYLPVYQKLYGDSMTYRQQLTTINGVQIEYAEPVLASTNELVASAETIEANAPAPPTNLTTTILTGLSEFITDRAQEEFNVTFMHKFRERLNDEEYAELRTLFPLSYDFLNQIDISNYKSALLSARQVFAEDIQKLGFNLPKVFDLAKYQKIRNIPEIYNLLVIYSILDLVYRDNSIDDVLPLTFRKVQKSSKELQKDLNLSLAASENSKKDRAALAGLIETHEQKLMQMRDDLIDKQIFLELAFLQTAVLPDSLRIETDSIYFDYLKKVDIYNNELHNAWDTIQEIPYNLKGKRFYETLMEEPSIDKFDIHFGEEPDSTELIAAGLELSRCMVCGINGNPNKAKILMEWDALLTRTQAKFDYLVNVQNGNTDAGLQGKLDDLEQQRQQLQSELLADLDFWFGKSLKTDLSKTQKFTENDSMALVYLSKTLDEKLFVEIQGNSKVETLEIRQNQFQKIRETIKSQLSDLKSKLQQESPLYQKLTKDEPVVAAISATNPALSELYNESLEIRHKINLLDEKYASDIQKTIENTKRVAKILELSSQLFLFLKVGDSEERTWLNTEQWNKLLNDDTQHDVFFGLLYQRLQSLYPSHDFNNQGLATLTTSFVYNLSLLKQQRKRLATKKKENETILFNDYLPFAQVVVSLINAVLETPILVDDAKVAYSIVEREETLQYIPRISDHTLNLFENINGQEYNYAIYNALELYKIISERTLGNCNNREGKDRKKCKKNEKTRNAFLVYGSFIADIALAQKPEDIRRALEVVALPPGSSRIKRQANYNVSLNSYFGLGAGRERLTDSKIKAAGLEQNSFSAGLTVPVGFSASWKFTPRQKGSFSIFVPILDLGAVTAIRFQENEIADNNDTVLNLPEFTFNNVISPGAYFMYNLPKNPFSLGLGVQHGPQKRILELNNEVFESGAWRLMFTATVDVPLFNLFGNRF